MINGRGTHGVTPGVCRMLLNPRRVLEWSASCKASDQSVSVRSVHTDGPSFRFLRCPDDGPSSLQYTDTGKESV
ncbi:hypothetical protein L2E82_29539 [Cichorium intybus]|uniref:Uncharacterized protein n=1 Tax=Cichorium intybus TaxID=13427 RepID=A0ACB9CYA9_CICIN|nr:hypothetical protein L2E82_29539 [Cichorium intybus]